MALITTAAREELIALFVAMFRAAPGSANLNAAVAAYESGATTAQIAASFSARAEFQSVYPALLTAEEFAAELVETMLDAGTPAGAVAWATNWVITNLQAGKSRAQVITEAVQAIRATTNPNYATAQAQLENRVEVATYYSVTQLQSSTNLSVLQNVIATVTADDATVQVAKDAVDGIVADSLGQTYTLTTGIDTINAGAGNDVINGVVNDATPANMTFTALDTLNAGAGNDVLNFFDTSAAGSASPTVSVSNVETVLARAAGPLTLNTTTWTGLTSLQATQSTTATLTAATTTDISVSGATGAVTINGGEDISVTAATAGQAVTIGATTVGAGTVTVSHSNQGAGAIAIDGGTAVTVTASGRSLAGGVITVGQGGAATDLPSGAVVITGNGNAYTAADAAAALGAITVTGGSSVTVTQTAASASTAAATDTSNIGSERTQGAVSITGGATTTSATVTQSAAVTAVDAVIGTTGVKEQQTVTFVALAAGATATVNGLSFKAAKALTAAEVAQAFQNLTAGTTVGSAPVANGTYSGTFNAGLADGLLLTSGAASGTTVVFTEGTASTAAFVLPVTGGTAAATTAGVTAVAGTTGVMGVKGGMVTVNGAITGADVLTTASLTGFGAGSTVVSDALTSLTLATSNEDVTVTSASTGALALTLNGAGTSANNADLTLGASLTGLNITTTGAASDINVTAAGVTALTIAGDKTVTLTGSSHAALQTITVSGSAGLTHNVSALATVTSVDASATSGAMSVTLDAATAAYKGGSGADAVTLSTTTVTKDITLGAGNDTLTLTDGTTAPAGMLTGGDGTDTLSMTAANAETVSAGASFETKFTGFEKLQLGVVAAAQTDTIDLSNLNDINYVISGGLAAGGSLVINKMSSGGTIEFTGAAATVTDITDVNLTDATGASDSLNVVTKVSGDLNFGVLDASGIETLAITATDTSTSTINTATLKVVDAALTSVTVSGNSHLKLDLDASVVALTTLNGSAMTGNLTATTNGTVAQTITGGAGADALTAKGTNDVLIGGAGNDTLTLAVGNNLVTLTGGAGNDTFVIGARATNVNSYATITDLAAGDKIQFTTSATDDFTAAQITLGDTAVFQDYANFAINATDAGDVSWFQYGGNTYVIQNISNGASFDNAQDIIVKITGAVNLSTASYTQTNETLVIN